MSSTCAGRTSTSSGPRTIRRARISSTSCDEVGHVRVRAAADLLLGRVRRPPLDAHERGRPADPVPPRGDRRDRRPGQGTLLGDRLGSRQRESVGERLRRPVRARPGDGPDAARRSSRSTSTSSATRTSSCASLPPSDPTSGATTTRAGTAPGRRTSRGSGRTSSRWSSTSTRPSSHRASAGPARATASRSTRGSATTGAPAISRSWRRRSRIGASSAG